MILITVFRPQAFATTKQLKCLPAALTYGHVPVGATETLLAAIINNGRSSVAISSVRASNSKFKVSNLKLPRVLAAGERLEVSVLFVPSKTGHVDAELNVFSNASNPKITLRLSGAGVTTETIAARPRTVSFGEVKMGESSTLPIALTNSRPEKLTLTSLQTTGSEFSVTGVKFPLTLAKGESVTLRATFKPSSTGLTGGSSFISGPSLNIPLTGTGKSASKRELTISPTTLNFGKVSLGTEATLSLGLHASGENVTVSSISSNSSEFDPPKVGLPLTILAGKEVLVNVTFKPAKSGNASGTLSFISNAVDTRRSEPISGSGVAPYVRLSWIASISPHVKGYNVYRGTSSGAQTRINSSLDAGTTYDDLTIVPGHTYYYSTTAVNSSGKESARSEKVEVVVP